MIGKMLLMGLGWVLYFQETVDCTAYFQNHSESPTHQ